MVNRLRHQPGFTLIELLVVMAVLGLLATLVMPRYFQSVDRAKEAVLRSNLAEVRGALDKYVSDTGGYPDSLKQLVDRRYLRRVPLDPVTARDDSWILVKPQSADLGGIYDVKSGAPGKGTDGSDYASW
jgi:general secretion pathway protein G